MQLYANDEKSIKLKICYWLRLITNVICCITFWSQDNWVKNHPSDSIFIVKGNVY